MADRTVGSYAINKYDLFDFDYKFIIMNIFGGYIFPSFLARIIVCKYWMIREICGKIGVTEIEILIILLS